MSNNISTWSKFVDVLLSAVVPSSFLLLIIDLLAIVSGKMSRAVRSFQAPFILLLLGLVTLNVRMLWRIRQPDTVQDETSCDASVINIAGSIEVKTLSHITNDFPQMELNLLDTNHTKVMSSPRPTPGLLTIGIPSIKRINGMGTSYLFQTLASVIDSTSADDKATVVVVVFLADLDVAYNQDVSRQIAAKYKHLILLGFLHVLQVAPDYYPQLDGLKRNFNDELSRVKWRAKQVADFALMFLYAKNISRYYIQIEDDVVCAPNFVGAIGDYIKSRRGHWAVLEFSELGFIGKLFKSADLSKLAQYMLTFYDEQPVDWLIRYFRMSMAQPTVIMRKPTLFQHMGLKSSFDTSKDNKLKDRFFDQGSNAAEGGNKIHGDNPSATVFSQITPYDKYTADLAYGSTSGYFWAVGVKESDTITVLFDTEQNLSRVVVRTGSFTSPHDILKNGWVQVSPSVVTHDPVAGVAKCSEPRTISHFLNGQVDVDSLNKTLNGLKVKCLQIVVGAGQKEWIIFDQIAVFVSQIV